MARNTTTGKEVTGMLGTKEKKQDADNIYMIYKELSEQGKIMMLAYSTAIRDKELADMGARQIAERPELAVVTEN